MNLKARSLCDDPSLPLRSKRRELFCRLYAGDLWGRPGEAFIGAGYKPRDGQALKAALKLLESADVRERVRRLRELRAENSVADPAWIKDHFVEIIEHAEKDADRIRALSSLQRSVIPGSQRRSKPDEGQSGQFHPELPLFEGGDDGEL